jgi:hypothetical protein
MPETKETLLNLVNASGFLFQHRIEQEISATDLKRVWEIAAREHRWFDSLVENEGFIDLVLKAGIARIVVECKRVTDANWVFLVPDKKHKTSNTRILWTMRKDSGTRIAEWHDFTVTPISHEATFCIVRGQGEKDTPMLERLSSLVLRSIESLASEELSYTGRSEAETCLYFPIIVTNATLHVCRFDPARIDISTGQIDDADFEQVPCVRFRKNLSSTTPSVKPRRDLETTNLSNERTIFVVSSDHLAETLMDWEIPYPSNAPWPWEGLR